MLLLLLLVSSTCLISHAAGLVPHTLTKDHRTSSYRLDARFISQAGTYPKPDSWKTYAGNGSRLYQAWRDKTGPDKPLASHSGRYFRRTREETVLDCPVEQALHDELLSPDNDDYLTLLFKWPKEGKASAIFDCSIDVKKGTFLANVRDRGNALPSAIKFSRVAWYMWTKAFLSAMSNRQYRQNPAAADYSTLSSFWSVTATGGFTSQLLEYIFQGDYDQPQTFYPDDNVNAPDLDNPFWPLLACPNMVAAIFLVTENKLAMKGKGITSIKVFAYDTGKPPPIFNIQAKIG